MLGVNCLLMCLHVFMVYGVLFYEVLTSYCVLLGLSGAKTETNYRSEENPICGRSCCSCVIKGNLLTHAQNSDASNCLWFELLGISSYLSNSLCCLMALNCIFQRQSSRINYDALSKILDEPVSAGFYGLCVCFFNKGKWETIIRLGISSRKSGSNCIIRHN